MNKQQMQGTLFFTTTYQPIEISLVNRTWPTNLNVADALPDKYEFFNDHLTNEFKDTCQFGYLTVELDGLKIPMMG